MPIIPVIDVKGGIVVQAIGGHREQYQPLKSVLTDSVRPLDVARAMLKATGSDKLYVADLDAIMYGREVDISISELAKALEVTIWLDAGGHISSGTEMIRGSESSDSIDDIQGCNAFSIDLRDGGLIWNGFSVGLTPFELAYEVIHTGVETLIVLDVASVGKREGPTTVPLCRQIREAFPRITLWTGGGLRTMDDIGMLEQSGVDGVLVSTAIHRRNL